MKVTRQEAWAAWRREDAFRQSWNKKVRAIERELEYLGEWADSLLTDEMAENARYRKVVDAFLDLRGYSKNMPGWRAACQVEPGLWKKTRTLPWPRLWAAILLSRRKRT